MSVSRSRMVATIVFVLSVALLFGLIRLGFLSMILLAGAAAVGSAAFLVMTAGVPPRSEQASRDRQGADQLLTRPRVGTSTRKTLKLLTSLIFFLFSGLSLLALISQPYEKPLTYYLLIAVAAVALTVQIGLVETRREVHATLVQVLLLALNLFGSNQVVFPLGIGGSDARVHIGLLIAPILETGHIPSDPAGFFYQSFPAHHLLVVVTSQVLMLDPATAYYVFGFLVMSLPILVVFLICRSLLDEKAGLLAALLLSGGSYFIFWASHAGPLSFSIPVISTLMLLVLSRIDHIGPGYVIVAVFLMASIVLTHPYSSVVFGFVLLGLVIFLGLSAAQRKAQTPHRRRAWGARGMALLFLVVLLAHWTYYSSMLTQSARLAAEYYAVLVGQQVLSAPAVYDSLPLMSIFLNTLGDAVLIALAVIGFLLIFSRGSSTREAIVIGPAVVLLVVSLAGVLISLLYLLPTRIYVFLLVLALVPLASIGLSLLCRGSATSRLTSWKGSRIALSAVLIGFVVFWSSASTIAGFETSPFVGDQPYVKLYDTNYERRSVDWVCRYLGAPATVQVSGSLAGPSLNQLFNCLAASGDAAKRIPVTLGNLIDIQALEGESFVLFSRYDLFPGFQSGLTGRGQYGQGINQRLDDDAGSRLSIFPKIYDSGDTAVFIVP